ncbi:MAG: hypothetical protein GY742_03345 [Hyphomicrobiales bacterium]|nr:hypothetical protein [Hyphomicrobiales bacterium]
MIEGYEQRKFSSDAMGGEPAEFDIFEKGEGPGIESETIKLAHKIAAAGFRVVMPHHFSPLGKFAILRMSPVCSVSGVNSTFFKKANQSCG